MKIENQVCTLKQAEKLKELGVVRQSFFYYYQCIVNGRETMPIVNYVNFDYGEYVENESINNAIYGNTRNEYYSAFTVAELGVMLPDYEASREKGYEFRPYQQYYSHTQRVEWKFDNPFTSYRRDTIVTSTKTEAEARAAMLIWLIEERHITPDEVNQRLQSV